VPFFENLFVKAQNYVFPGSATANYFYTVYGTYAASDLDALNDMDRLRLSDGTCISAPGCNTFFALRSAGLRTWENAGNFSYHGGQLVVRRPIHGGWGFDFNYTLSHALDIASGSESGGTGQASKIQDAFNPRASYGPADFDIRHNITTNAVVELPFGAGKALLANTPRWMNHVVAGWQVSMLARYRTGLPYSTSNNGVYPTNYLNSAIAILRPGEVMPETGVGYNQNGNPSIFRNTTATDAFMGQYAGYVGTRGIVRVPAC
jgi:hypothetical protein